MTRFEKSVLPIPEAITDLTEQVMAFLSEQGVWFGCILLLFLAWVDEVLVKANSIMPPALPTGAFLGAMALLFAAIGLWAVRMFRRFSRPG